MEPTLQYAAEVKNTELRNSPNHAAKLYQATRKSKPNTRNDSQKPNTPQTANEVCLYVKLPVSSPPRRRRPSRSPSSSPRPSPASRRWRGGGLSPFPGPLSCAPRPRPRPRPATSFRGTWGESGGVNEGYNYMAKLKFEITRTPVSHRATHPKAARRCSLELPARARWHAWESSARDRTYRGR